LTDLADLPAPIGKRPVVSQWNDDDWNFDEVETKPKFNELNQVVKGK
jgi:hypothetical protein